MVMVAKEVTTERVYEVLMTVMDPEIDSVSIVDLGMVESVTVEGNDVKFFYCRPS